MDNNAQGQGDQKDVAKAATPEKSILEKVFEATGSIDKVESKEEDSKEEIKPDPQVDLYKGKILEIKKDLEGEIKEIKALLPNTKDEAKKLELERKIFEKEKKMHSLFSDLEEQDVPEFSQLNSFFKENNISESSESYKLAQKMLTYKSGAADLIKMYLRIGQTIAKDLNKTVPVDLNTNIKGAEPKKSVTFDEGSWVDQVIKNFKK